MNDSVVTFVLCLMAVILMVVWWRLTPSKYTLSNRVDRFIMRHARQHAGNGWVDWAHCYWFGIDKKKESEILDNFMVLLRLPAKCSRRPEVWIAEVKYKDGSSSAHYCGEGLSWKIISFSLENGEVSACLEDCKGMRMTYARHTTSAFDHFWQLLDFLGQIEEMTVERYREHYVHSAMAQLIESTKGKKVNNFHLEVLRRIENKLSYGTVELFAETHTPDFQDLFQKVRDGLEVTDQEAVMASSTN